MRPRRRQAWAPGPSTSPLVASHMPQQPVAVTRYVLAFAAIYLLLLIGVGALVRLGGLQSGSFLRIVALIAAATLAALWFMRRNRRALLRVEYVKIVCASIAVDLIIQGGGLLAVGPLPADKVPLALLILCGHAVLLAMAYSRWSGFLRSYARRLAGP